MDGITVLSPDPKQIGTEPRWTCSTNGRSRLRELRDSVAAKGEVTLDL